MSDPGIIHALGIRMRVLILAVFPIVTVVLLLGYTLGSNRLQDAQQNFTERGQLIAQNLAMSAELPFFTRNIPLLQDTLQRTAQQFEVRWAGLWDARQRVVIGDQTAAVPVDSERLINAIAAGLPTPPGVFHAPISVPGIPLSDIKEPRMPGSSDSSEVLGYAIVALSPQRNEESRRGIIANTALITLSGLLGTLLLALLIGNSITDPLLRLLQAVRELRSGNLNARASVKAGGEIRDLEQGINAMARSLQNAQRGLEARVDAAVCSLRDTVAELEQRNVELEEARQAAHDAGIARTQFLARMSHEIRTPLNAIVGFAQLLENDDHPESRQERLGTIRLAADQLLHVINDILQFIRLESGATRLESLQFNIRDLLEDVVAMLAPMAADKQLDLVLLPHSDLPERMLGDPSRLSQVVVNLVNNAIKFTSRGQIVIEASRHLSEDGQEWIRLAVRDSGIGIESAHQERIFSAFSQGDSSINRRFGGTGLGLAIAHQLIALMQGRIEVSSTPGKGSTFCIDLPCPDCDAPEPIERSGPMSGQRALVYDANAMMRRSLRNMLTQSGLQVYHAGEWQKALGIIDAQGSSTPFDIVLLGLSFAEQEAPILDQYLVELAHRYHGDLLLLTPTEPSGPPPNPAGGGKLLRATKPIRRRALRRLLESAAGGQGSDRETARRNQHIPRLPGLRVLIAEDNRINRELLRHVLVAEGASVVEAEYGGDAVQLANAERFDIILMDLHMPEVDGFEATREIRANLAGKTPPIFVLTADVFGRSDRTEGPGIFDGWLLKPIDPESLVQRLSPLAPAYGPSAAGDSVDSDNGACLPAELRTHYCEAILDLIQRLDAATARAENTELQQLLHDLKGITGIYDEPDLSRLAVQLKPGLLVSDKPAWSDVLTQLKAAAKRSCRETDRE